MPRPKFIPLTSFKQYARDEMINRSQEFYEFIKKRRTVRNFSEKKVAPEVIENCIRTAGTAPSGANLQPWHFVVVSDPEIKKKIRVAAEEEEKDFYKNRAPKEWLDALAHLGTDEHKPFLETAPYLIAIFSKSYEFLPDGKQSKKLLCTRINRNCMPGLLIAAFAQRGISFSYAHTKSNELFN